VAWARQRHGRRRRELLCFIANRPTHDRSSASLLRLHGREPIAHPLRGYDERPRAPHVRAPYKGGGWVAARYNANRLVWFEVTGNVSAAIAREKELKGYSRKKKVALIEAANAGWNDLAEELGLVARDADAG
jgi:hypothetical protein